MHSVCILFPHGQTGSITSGVCLSVSKSKIPKLLEGKARTLLQGYLVFVCNYSVSSHCHFEYGYIYCRATRVFCVNVHYSSVLANKDLF